MDESSRIKNTVQLAAKQIENFHADGAVLIKGLLSDWIDEIREGIERNIVDPGPYAAENLKPGEPGRFFEDYCNWRRIPEFEAFVFQSGIGRISAQLMRSKSAQMFHDHVLVKEPGTEKATPWHQDTPYYFVGGNQTVSFWCPIDPVSDATSRRLEDDSD